MAKSRRARRAYSPLAEIFISIGFGEFPGKLYYDVGNLSSKEPLSIWSDGQNEVGEWTDAGLEAVALPLHQSDGILGKVGNDEIGPGPLDGGQELHHDPVFLKPSELSRGLDHGILP